MPETARSHWLPWRSAVCGWLVAGVLLAASVPLFLRMPLWCDVTLYAVAVQSVRAGGVHYRDVFDTNPPGFVWLLYAVRGAVGPSSEALRAADLVVVGLVTAGLLWWARAAGADRAAAAWAGAAGAAFYPFTQEFNHAQRDVWMMLPAGAALVLRLKRVEGRPSPLRGLAEGLLWGLGCWVKPHLLFVAFAAWLVTARRLPWRDHLAVFAGGAAAGLAGVGWLVASGSWPHFVDIWRTWNVEYLRNVGRELPARVFQQLDYFPPYSLCALPAVPLAVANLRTRSGGAPAQRRRALAAVYLGWLGTAFFLQRGYHYVHVPETLLMLALFAANRWPVPVALVGVQLVTGLCLLDPGRLAAHYERAKSSLVYRAVVDRHPAFDPQRAQWWGACLGPDPPRAARRDVAMWARHFAGTDPVELGPVADFLRAQNVRDGELIAWHDSPHALYLDLGVRPGFRFMHVGTAAGLGRWQEQTVLRELRAALPHVRFAVSDLHRVTEKYGELNDAGPDGLPGVLPVWQRNEFPFDQPVVFRSPGGRYLVHRVENPVTSARIPVRLDQAEPPKE